jgi:oxygen-dependent protoporphyrinogen oxidase
MNNKEVIVIGAGLTGLATAHYLKKAGINFHVLEQMDRPGGVIQSASENGFNFENGPNTGVIGTAEVVELFDDLKGLCELEVAKDNVNTRYILKNGKWEKLPGGLIEGIKTKLFTWKDKFRILGEPFRSKGKNPHETLSELVLRRMGKSFLEYAVDPFILGVYAGDPSYLVTKYALPKLYNLEQNYGSFIGGTIKKGLKKKDEQAKKITRKVFSAKGGLSNLTDALYQSAGKENFSFGLDNIQVSKADGTYIISGQKAGENIEIKANQVITTTGAFALEHILPFVSKEEIAKITNLKYAKVIEVVLGFNDWKGRSLDGFGGLIPFKEKRDVLGYLFLSSFLENKAPQNGALLTIFMGGMRRAELVELSDNKIKEIVERETINLMDLAEFKPDLIMINRYEHAIPQYSVDSGQRFETIEKLQDEHIGLIIGGNLRNGIGMADRIKQGKELADEAVKNIKLENKNFKQ